VRLRATEKDGAVVVDVLVKPRSAREQVGPAEGDRLRVAVTAPPVDGEANAAVVDALARALGVPRGAVEIARGAAGRRKTVRIRGATLAAVVALGARRS
jgi:hypothetical protein